MSSIKRLQKLVKSGSLKSLVRPESGSAASASVDFDFMNDDQQHIRTLERKIEVLNAELGSRASTLLLLERNIEILSNTAKKDHDRIKDLEEEAFVKQNEVARLQKNVNIKNESERQTQRLKLENTTLHEQITKLTTQINEIQDALKRSDQNKLVLSQNLEKIQEEYKIETERKETAQKKLQLYEEQLCTINAQTEQIDSSLIERNEEISKLKSEIEIASNEKNTMTKDIEEKDRLIGLLRSELADWKGELDNLVEQKRNVQFEIRSTREHWEDRLGKLTNNYESQIHEINERNEKIQQVYQKRIDDLKKSKVLLESTVFETTNELSSLKKMFNDSSSNCIELEKKVSIKAEQISLLTRSLNSVEKERDELKSRLNTLASAEHDVTQRLEHHEAMISQAVESATLGFKQEVQYLQQENTSLAGKLMHLDEETAEELRNSKNEIFNIQAELQKAHRQINQLKIVIEETKSGDYAILLRGAKTTMESNASSLIRALESLKTELTCPKCFNLCVNPITVIPCGHTYCGTCWNHLEDDSKSSGKNPCLQCHDVPREAIIGTFINDLFSSIIAKTKHMSDITTRIHSAMNSLKLPVLE
ncbi:hypothetical protein PCE1_000875 [Barthelona sp. PCE]